jgi:hypothetical protein
MTRPAGLWQWQQTVSTYLPPLSKPQVTVLVLWSFGMVLAQTCGLTTVAITLAYVLGCSERTIREQLRDWYRDAQHKSGATRGRKRRSLSPLCPQPAARPPPSARRASGRGELAKADRGARARWGHCRGGAWATGWTPQAVEKAV